ACTFGDAVAVGSRLASVLKLQYTWFGMNLTRALTVTLLITLTTIPPAPPPAAGPLFRDPIHDGAADPVVTYNRARKTWWMFYTNRRADIDDTTGVRWVHGTRIGIAESRDGGGHWHYVSEADIPVDKPDYTLWAPEVIEANGAYHMFLTVVPGTFSDWNAPRYIEHLTSKD